MLEIIKFGMQKQLKIMASNMAAGTSQFTHDHAHKHQSRAVKHLANLGNLVGNVDSLLRLLLLFLLNFGGRGRCSVLNLLNLRFD